MKQLIIKSIDGVMQRLRRIRIRAAVVMALVAPAFAVDSPAPGNVVFYQPAEFSGVPAWAIAELNARGCCVPQAHYFKKQRHNAIRGEFVAKGQVDWAALCSKNGRSSIVLLSTSKARCAQELAAADDSVYLQQVAPNQQAQSRLISVAPNSVIAPQNGGFDHEGVVDELAKKRRRSSTAGTGSGLIRRAGIDSHPVLSRSAGWFVARV